MTTCFLCIAVRKKISSLIDINSAKGQRENMAEIIQLHLQIKANEEVQKYICTICWKSLFTFHKFYKRIHKCQRALEETLLNHDIITAEKNTKLHIIEDLPIRRRERSQPAATENKETSIDLQLNIDIEKCVTEVVDVDSNIKRELEDLELVKVEVTEQKLEDSAEETPIDETVIEQCVADLCTLTYEDPIDSSAVGASITEISSNKTNNNNTNYRNTKKNIKKKMLCSQTKRISKISKTKLKQITKSTISKNKFDVKESDEFIAQHFKLTCSICEQSVDNFTLLRQHFRSQHNIPAYVICCGKKLMKRCVVVDHINFHQNPDYFKCMKCDKTFSSRNSLESHNKVQHESDEPQHQCELCPKRFWNRAILTQHVLIHASEQDKTVPCPKCEKTFVNTYSMNKHLRIVHLNTYAKVCHICGKLIRGGPSWMKWHLDEHAGIEHIRSECEICGAKVKGKYGLKRHKRLVHNEENLTPQVCPICGKESPTLSRHKSHMKYVHIMERKFACTLCDKVFKRPVTLKEHMTTHTGERLYTCPHCPKTFSSNANMHSHRKKSHPKEFEEKRREKQREMFGHLESYIEKEVDEVLQIQ